MIGSKEGPFCRPLAREGGWPTKFLFIPGQPIRSPSPGQAGKGRRFCLLACEHARACWDRIRIGRGGSILWGQARVDRRARAARSPVAGAGTMFTVKTHLRKHRDLPPSRPAITLPGPGAMQPALSDYTRLLDIFLAGRNPRTLAACQADLEDFRRFMETRSDLPDRR